MLDGERVVGKATKSSKNNIGNTPNNVFSSSEIEEEEGEFAGPSTSNYKNNDSTVDDLSHYTEDLDVNEHRSKRELFSEFRRLLDHDSVFHRIRSEILSDLERMAQEQATMENKQLSHRQRFEYLEQLDDLLETKNDLNEAHMAILRNAAIQLSKHAPLEIMTNDFELEHLFVVPEKRKDKIIEEEFLSPPKKARKARNVEEPKSSTVAVQKAPQTVDDTLIKIDIPTQPIVKENDKVKESLRETKSNGLPNGESSNGKSHIARESPSKSIEIEKPSNKVTENVEIKNEDLKKVPKVVDSDQSSPIDSKETRNCEKTKKLEPKKLIKKPVVTKPNGVPKPSKVEKVPNRRASERQGSKASRTPEPEAKKPKRRTAIPTAPTPEPVIEQPVRPSSQRRATRNTQPNNELSNIDEQTYCVCDQVSFGNMIGCDNDRCNIEWFHFDCVGLKVKPGKGQKWYCPSCRGEKSNVMKTNTRR